MAGTLHNTPSGLAGYTFTASGECLELNSTDTIAGPFGPNVPAITDEGFKARQSLTNYVPGSQDFVAWSLWASATVTADVAAAPDGTTTADRITFGSAADSEVYRSGLAGPAAGASTLSVWARTESGTKTFRLRCHDGTSNYLSSDFTATTAWQRFTFVATTGAASNLFGIINASAGGGGSILAWQAQHLQNNLPDGGPLIVTTTAAATRGEALLTHNIFADGSALVDQDMLIWAKGKLNEIAGDQRPLELSDGSSANRILVWFSNGTPRAEVRAASTTVYSQAAGAAVTAGAEVTVLLRRLTGEWRVGRYTDSTLTWGTAVAAAFPSAVAKIGAGNAVPGGASLRGTLDSTFIKPGTFDTDQKIIDAITGAP